MTELSKQPYETELEHHKRLIYGKLVDGSLADADYAEMAPYVYGREYSTDSARKMMYGSVCTLQLLDEAADREEAKNGRLGELEAQKIALQKERQKLSDERTAYNAVVRARSRQEELNELITAVVSSGQLPRLEYSPSEAYVGDNDLLVSLNDIHYGACIDNYWNRYDSDVCRDMMGRYLDRIIAIGREHHSERCIVWDNGDNISGSIHKSIAITNKENVIEQITGVSELIAEFLVELSAHFSQVQYVSVAGNHSRMDQKKDALKDERLDDLVEWYLAARLQGVENIVVGGCDKVDSTMYLLDVRGKTYLGVHGDYEPTPAKVQSLVTLARQPVYAILSGHKHHNRVDSVQGVKTVMAGSFLGMDDLCVKSRIMGQPEQLVCVCDDTGIRCYYDVDLRG